MVSGRGARKRASRVEASLHPPNAGPQGRGLCREGASPRSHGVGAGLTLGYSNELKTAGHFIKVLTLRIRGVLLLLQLFFLKDEWGPPETTTANGHNNDDPWAWGSPAAHRLASCHLGGVQNAFPPGVGM